MSDTLTHIAIADLCGKAVSSLKKPLLAFLIGLLSHGVLDVTDNDYTLNISSYEAFKKDTDYVCLQVSGICYKVYDIFSDQDRNRFNCRLAAVLGSLTPDLIDGFYIYLYPEKWHSGQLLFPFHKPVSIFKQQTKSISMLKTTMITIASVQINF
jgi:hypothetical protein